MAKVDMKAAGKSSKRGGKGAGAGAERSGTEHTGSERARTELARPDRPYTGRKATSAVVELESSGAPRVGNAGKVASKAGVIDAFEFARLSKEASGSTPLVRFARAVQDLPEQPGGKAGEVHWSVRGETGRQGKSQGEPLLHLHVQAGPILTCQRCMEPFVYAIDARVTLHLVKSEAELDDGLDDSVHDKGEGESEDGNGDGIDDAPEKVLGSRNFDLLAQVEDELILNIPYVPRHEMCPGAPLKTSAGEPVNEADAEKRPSPFAVLEKLKQKH